MAPIVFPVSDVIAPRAAILIHWAVDNPYVWCMRCKWCKSCRGRIPCDCAHLILGEVSLPPLRAPRARETNPSAPYEERMHGRGQSPETKDEKRSQWVQGTRSGARLGNQGVWKNTTSRAENALMLRTSKPVSLQSPKPRSLQTPPPRRPRGCNTLIRSSG